VEQLAEAIATLLGTDTRGDSDVVAQTAARCHDSLRRAAESVQRARAAHQRGSSALGPAFPIGAGGGEELVAAELRTALDELGLVVGAVYTDDILDRIFSRFCIGK
jgi:tRNA modification GTPase